MEKIKERIEQIATSAKNGMLEAGLDESIANAVSEIARLAAKQMSEWQLKRDVAIATIFFESDTYKKRCTEEGVGDILKALMELEE